MIESKHVRWERKHVGICISICVYKLNEFIEFVKQKIKTKEKQAKTDAMDNNEKQEKLIRLTIEKTSNKNKNNRELRKKERY